MIEFQNSGQCEFFYCFQVEKTSPTSKITFFHDIYSLLKINQSLSPHSCRRFFCMEKLRETNGDLNLVRLLLGHSSLKMVMEYHDTDKAHQTLIGQRNTLDLGKVLERNERGTI